ncbi:zinc knuckle protein [Rhizophagus clarus]|uniref:Zinc knuckle protein n=1 Tax=Rhizophagus clarus TaxID=94130 RepID=A0A8H3LIT9_9GLOM|nr:zinc knuckle protein [Rhizophagus clarus]
MTTNNHTANLLKAQDLTKQVQTLSYGNRGNRNNNGPRFTNQQTLGQTSQSSNRPNQYVCYACGEPGHVVRTCLNKNNNSSHSPVAGSIGATRRWGELTFKLRGVPHEGECTRQMTIPSNLTLLEAYPATRTTRSKARLDPTAGIVRDKPTEEEMILRTVQGSSKVKQPTRTTKTKKVEPKKIIKKKPAVVAPIYKMVEPYTLQQFFDQKADITNGQLLAMNPKFGLTIAKQLRKPVVRAKDNEKNSIKKNDKMPDDKNTLEVDDLIQVANTAGPNADRTSALYCEASIKHIKFPLIVDSGSARITDIPLRIHDCIIPMDAIVTDANSYAAIVGNDWLRKTKAILDYNNNLMTIEWKDQVLEVFTECREMPHHISSIEVPNIEAEDEVEEEVDEDAMEESEDEFESDDEEAQEQLFCNAKFITRERAQEIEEELKEGNLVSNEYYYQYEEIEKGKCHPDWTKVLPNVLSKPAVHKGRDTTIVGHRIDCSIQKSMEFASRSSRKEKWQEAPVRRLSEVEQRHEKRLLSFAKDNINISSKTFEEHLQHLEQVFLRLEQARLKLSPEKCFFFKDEIPFLGHVVSQKGIQTDPEKLRVIKEFPVPKDLTQLHSFIVLASYYCKFVKGFSSIAEPLNRLLKKNTLYIWSKDQHDAFEKLKTCLTTPPILAYPNFEKPFILYTDASIFALGAILSQKNENNCECVLAYASRTLNKHERNYSITELECLAVVWSVRHFHQYLHGQKFTVITDHAALRYLMNLSNPVDKLGRWLMILNGYEIEIINRPRKLHSNIDTLSRIRT